MGAIRRCLVGQHTPVVSTAVTTAPVETIAQVVDLAVVETIAALATMAAVTAVNMGHLATRRHLVHLGNSQIAHTVAQRDAI